MPSNSRICELLTLRAVGLKAWHICRLWKATTCAKPDGSAIVILSWPIPLVLGIVLFSPPVNCYPRTSKDSSLLLCCSSVVCSLAAHVFTKGYQTGPRLMRVRIESVRQVCRYRVSFLLSKQAESFHKCLPLMGEQFLEGRHELKDSKGIQRQPLNGLRQFSFFKECFRHLSSSL